MYAGLESRNLGCGGGSGSDVSDILRTAGVSVATNLDAVGGADIDTGMRADEGCDHMSNPRSKRSIDGKQI